MSIEHKENFVYKIVSPHFHRWSSEQGAFLWPSQFESVCHLTTALPCAEWRSLRPETKNESVHQKQHNIKPNLHTSSAEHKAIRVTESKFRSLYHLKRKKFRVNRMIAAYPFIEERHKAIAFRFPCCHIFHNPSISVQRNTKFSKTRTVVLNRKPSMTSL